MVAADDDDDVDVDGHFSLSTLPHLLCPRTRVCVQLPLDEEGDGHFLTQVTEWAATHRDYLPQSAANVFFWLLGEVPQSSATTDNWAPFL